MPALIAEGDIVHGALRGRHDTEGAEQCIHHG